MFAALGGGHTGVHNAGAINPTVASLASIRYFAKDAAGIANGRQPAYIAARACTRRIST